MHGQSELVSQDLLTSGPHQLLPTYTKAWVGVGPICPVLLPQLSYGTWAGHGGQWAGAGSLIPLPPAAGETPFPHSPAP